MDEVKLKQFLARALLGKALSDAANRDTKPERVIATLKQNFI
jgi:hypothetical protein